MRQFSEYLQGRSETEGQEELVQRDPPKTLTGTQDPLRKLRVWGEKGQVDFLLYFRPRTRAPPSAESPSMRIGDPAMPSH